MKHYVNGVLRSESSFWHELEGKITEIQKIRLLEGRRIQIRGNEYVIVDERV